MPCSERRARKLLAAGRARVHRLIPFAIRLIDRTRDSCNVQPMRLSLDPGSKVTGLAVARVATQVQPESGKTKPPVMHVAFLMELTHRGHSIRDGLRKRALLRRGRRRRNARYRAPRFSNRRKQKGRLSPSLRHRVESTGCWVRRLCNLAPIAHLAQELARFDTQAMQADEEGREIEGLDYQRGTLAGYEVGEYLLAKWEWRCAYCDARDVPLQKDHIVPRARGGSNRVSNLALACEPCNQAKGALDVREFLADKPDHLRRVLEKAKASLVDAAAVNTTRKALLRALGALGLPIEVASGGRTKFNRIRLGVSKTHAWDAACVGEVGDVRRAAQSVLYVKCTGHGSRCKTNVDAYGFPRGYVKCQKSVHGFRTGDRVRAVVLRGKKAGIHVGRVAVRRTGNFDIQTAGGTIQGINHKHCALQMRGDGYSYSHVAPTRKECAETGRRKRRRALPRLGV